MPPILVPAFLPRCRHGSHACTPSGARAFSIVHMTEGLLDIVCEPVFRSWPAIDDEAEIRAASDPDSGKEAETFP